MTAHPPLHQGEPADAALLEAIIHVLTDTLPVSTIGAVVLFGVLIVVVPLTTVALAVRHFQQPTDRRSDVG